MDFEHTQVFAFCVPTGDKKATSGALTSVTYENGETPSWSKERQL
jgi:hypothetical protein